MKCPECVKTDQRSKVYCHGSSSTSMGWSPFYDEDGEYHQHNPNSGEKYYKCSNGHSFTTPVRQACPNPKCHFDKTSEEIAQQQKPQCCGGGPQWGHSFTCRTLP
ncbi:hypothetical protein [Mycolicibacterium mucogenicum]|uniref:Uncharacterized protein n=1 Tax=Mycolicibacterium mucogenicum DSM 44124 TaxID=1226753 RepID=A0A8H2PJV2_MYCMU|nr:hypothetical protein [Mycolicibacterium mucogenicum]KAB7755227.1 hypothetical protein MMUC44124_20785 [Mycolicibacterium mucogenicum DSM 44124]QPG68902.1 hypothetical protein C1S78_026375 [Mycolicibacterium mucogenicum DSM 44124]